MFKEGEGTKESAFNIAIKFLEGIQESLKDCEQYYMEGRLMYWNKKLDAIYRRVPKNKLKEEEKTALEKARNTAIGKNNKFVGNANVKQNSTLKKEYQYCLEKYEEELIGILDRLGWLVPTKETIEDMMRKY